MDVESTELFRFRQMKLLRRGRYCAPIAENKRNSAGLKNHRETKIHLTPQLCNPRKDRGPFILSATNQPPTNQQWTSTSPTGSLLLPSSPPAARPASPFCSETGCPSPPTQPPPVRSAAGSPAL